MSDLKLPGEENKKKGEISFARIAIWVIVGGVGLYLVISGVVGIIAAKLVDLKQHGGADDGTTELRNQVVCGAEGAAGCEHIVNQQHGRAIGNVIVRFDRRGAVFQRVGDGCGGPRQLARLANGDEPNIGVGGGGTGEEGTWAGSKPDPGAP